MIQLPDNVNVSQERFLADRTPYSLMCGGVGSGKSVALQYKAIQLKGANGRLPGLLMAETLGELMSNVVDPMMEMLADTLPDHLNPHLHFDPKGRRYISWPDGCKIHLRSAKSIESYAGLNVAWLCGDEPWLWQHKAYLKACERVRIKAATRLQRAFTSTPAMNYLSDEYNTGRRFRNTITCGTHENAHNLADGYVEGLLQAYSRRMARAMIYGEWTVLEGAVYEAFDPNGVDSPWFIDYDPEPNTWRRSYLAVDPGFNRSAWLWIHALDETTWVVYDQMMPETMSDDACVQKVNDRGWPIDEIWCDPAADQVQSAISIDTIDMMQNIRTRDMDSIRYVTHPFTRIAYGVDKLRTLLGDPEDSSPIRIFFAKHLMDREREKTRGIIKDMAAYRYPEVKDDKPIGDNPLKDGKTDHSCDALRQFAVGMWLTSPLREIDPKLAAYEKSGVRIAA